MDKTERLLWEYCGLTFAQYGCLRDAVDGMLFSMNGARRQVMQELIGQDLKATDAGEKLYQRARKAIGDGIIEPDCVVAVENTAKTARLINNFVRNHRKYLMQIHSAHVKVLLALARQPGLSWRFLMAIYGHNTVMSLWNAGLIVLQSFDGQKDWGWFVLSSQARALLQMVDGLA